MTIADPDQGLPVCYSCKHFVNSSPENYLFENKKRKMFEILEHLPCSSFACVFIPKVHSKLLETVLQVNILITLLKQISPV